MGIVSIAYMLMTAVMLVMIIRKKEITIAGVLAILIVGTVFTGNPVKGVIVLCSAITAGMSEMLPIFIGISLIVDGLWDILTMLYLRSYVKKYKKGMKSSKTNKKSSEFIDAEIEEYDDGFDE